MRKCIYIFLSLVYSFLSCESPAPVVETKPVASSDRQLPYLTYHRENVFPGDSSLLRAEDGIALENGNILVVDQSKGLRLIEKDGTTRQFGKFQAAGFVYDPPRQIPSPNGVALEPDGKHLLMADLETGKIYRIDLASEDVEVAYDHPYGLNAVYMDRKGAIWFTQSAKSTNVKELVSELNFPVPHGAVYRMSDFQSTPVKVVDSLYFANGLTMDREEKHLYVAETMMDRVHMFDVDTERGTVEYNGIAASVVAPDNLLTDQEGRLFIALTFTNQVVAVDFKNHSQHLIFDGSTKENVKLSNELHRRNHLGLERFKFRFTGISHPLPGSITGMFFSRDYETLYITNLGKDLLKYSYQVNGANH